MLLLATMPFKSSDVASGDGSCLGTMLEAEGVRRCFIRYEADRGRAGLVLLGAVWWKEGLRLTSGELGVDEAGDLLEGGV